MKHANKEKDSKDKTKQIPKKRTEGKKKLPQRNEKRKK